LHFSYRFLTRYAYAVCVYGTDVRPSVCMQRMYC